MLCYPLDNTEYEANALGAFCGTRTRGVFSDDGHYAVTYNDNMTVTVSPGLAWLKASEYWGVAALEVSPQVLTIDTADGALSRIDAVCVRLDKNRNNGEVVIKKGAYTPQPPTIAAPVHNLDFDEVYVATVKVRAGTTAITQSDITDQRLHETYCGLMRDGVTGIPTAQLQAQANALIAQLQKAIEQTVSGAIPDGAVTTLKFAPDAVAPCAELLGGKSAAEFATAAQGALAVTAMPKTGGAFVGVATAHAANTAAAALRNAEVRITSAAGALQSTGKLIFVRK